MNKKLFRQIRNEWKSNLWLIAELLLISVVMWYILDFIYVKASIFYQPRGFDISHCYLLRMGRLDPKSPKYMAKDTTESEDIRNILTRIRHRPEVEAASLSANSYPYNGSNSSTSIRYDTLQNNNWLIRRLVTPDFLRVFKYEGSRGETPSQLASMMDNKSIMASNNIFKKKYHIKLTTLVGKKVIWGDDTTTRYKLAAAYTPVRYDDYSEAYHSYSMLYKLPEGWYTTDNNLELCIRVKPSMDHDFIKKLWKDCERHINTGNVYITNITSFKDVRKKFQQYQSNQIRNFVTGIIFLLLNIFLGLLGTFWFRTQQRRSEIALQMALGSTRRQIFLRQISEGIIILVLASIPAIIIDLNIAYAGLTQYMHGATLQPGRFIITVSATFLISAIMIIIGDWFPARKATKVQPAEALHED